MKYVLDTHTHTLVSGHAYNTIKEMVSTASEKGLQLLAITDHAPTMPGTCHEFYFQNLKVFDETYMGLPLLLGAEVNIIDYEGNVDLPEWLLKNLKPVIASIHIPCLKPGTREENTQAYIGAIKNPYIHIIGHPDDARYPVDYEAIVQAALEYHKALEINNTSLSPVSFRENARDNDIRILELCKQYNVPITLGSDAHIDTSIGDFRFADELIQLTDFPEELILNTSVDRFMNYLNKFKNN